MCTQTHRLTYEEYLKTPEIKARFDIVDGVMTIAPTPTVAHQRILGNLFWKLDQFVSEQQVGEVLFAPVDVIVQRDSLRTRQPDLLFVSNERASILGDQVDGAPIWLWRSCRQVIAVPTWRQNYPTTQRLELVNAGWYHPKREAWRYWG